MITEEKKERKRKKSNVNLSIYDKLYLKKIKPDVRSHIKVNVDICKTCWSKDCTKFCPSNVFFWSERDDKLIISYENCLECGACSIGCPFENIEFNYPNGGYGIYN